MAAKGNFPSAMMTAQEVAEYLQVHPRTIYKLLRKDQLPGFKIGADWRFDAEEPGRWFRERSRGGDEQSPIAGVVTIKSKYVILLRLEFSRGVSMVVAA